VELTKLGPIGGYPGAAGGENRERFVTSPCYLPAVEGLSRRAVSSGLRRPLVRLEWRISSAGQAAGFDAWGGRRQGGWRVRHRASVHPLVVLRDADTPCKSGRWLRTRFAWSGVV
jgi:hypothetical protein